MSGSLGEAIEVATGRTPEVMGKPHRPMMEAAQARAGRGARVVMVGDTPATDLAGGRLMGWPTVLVLSGTTTRDDATTVDPEPDLVLDSITDVPAGLRGDASTM